MPVYAEVGPLILDQAVEEKVMGYLADETSEFNVNIEEIPFEMENKPGAFPIEGKITLKKDEKTLEIFMMNGEEKGEAIVTCKYSDQYPSIDFIKKTPTLFELHWSSEQSIKLSTETSIDRDIIATSIRMFGNDDFRNQKEFNNTEVNSRIELFKYKQFPGRRKECVNRFQVKEEKWFI